MVSEAALDHVSKDVLAMEMGRMNSVTLYLTES
jgi:hypothetical protein